MSNPFLTLLEQSTANPLQGRSSRATRQYHSSYSRIVSSLRPAQASGPAQPKLNFPFKSVFPDNPLSKPSVGSPVARGPMFDVPLSRAGIDNIEGPMPRPQYPSTSKSIYDVVKGRIAPLARGALRAAVGVGRVAATALSSLGPLGVAIGVALVVAASIGALAYYLHKRNGATVEKVVDDTVDKTLPIVEEPVKATPVKRPLKHQPDLSTGWEHNVPWQRRPGRDLNLSEIVSLNDMLGSLNRMGRFS